jgi:hypothetical protein
VVLANCADREEQHELPAGRWTVRFDTHGALDDRPASAALRLAPAQALVLEASG